MLRIVDFKLTVEYNEEQDPSERVDPFSVNDFNI